MPRSIPRVAVLVRPKPGTTAATKRVVVRNDGTGRAMCSEAMSAFQLIRHGRTSEAPMTWEEAHKTLGRCRSIGYHQRRAEAHEKAGRKGMAVAIRARIGKTNKELKLERAADKARRTATRDTRMRQTLLGVGKPDDSFTLNPRHAPDRQTTRRASTPDDSFTLSPRLEPSSQTAPRPPSTSALLPPGPLPPTPYRRRTEKFEVREPSARLEQARRLKAQRAAEQVLSRSAVQLSKGSRAYLADLRERHPEIDRQTFDAAMTRATRRGKVILMPLENPVEITPRHEAATLRTPSGFARHIFYADASPAPARPSGTVPAAQPAATPASPRVIKIARRTPVQKAVGEAQARAHMAVGHVANLVKEGHIEGTKTQQEKLNKAIRSAHTAIAMARRSRSAAGVRSDGLTPIEREQMAVLDRAMRDLEARGYRTQHGQPLHRVDPEKMATAHHPDRWTPERIARANELRKQRARARKMRATSK